MYDDSGRPPISSSKLLVVLLVALVIVMIGTVVLNGGFSSPTINENTSNNTINTDEPSVQYKKIGSDSYGFVTKISGFGDPSSDIKVALILGVDSNKKSNAVISTLENENLLNYCYDIYIINTTSNSKNSSNDNNDNSLTVNEMSESLAAEYAVPDIINNNYNFTVDIHSTNDSNSYIFVPSENTYTSRLVVDYISNNTNVGKYTPDSHSYTELISEKIISNDIPSIVYVSREYYNNNVSTEISSVIGAIDQFDFINLFSTGYDSSMDDSSSDDDYNNTVTVSSSSSGNVEVN